jgi:hypothetical protein
MGLFTSIVSKVKESVVGKVLDTVTTAFVHPIQTVSAIISPTKTVAQVTEAHFEQSLGKQIGQTVLATAGYAAATLTAGAVAAKGVAATAASLIPTTLKGKAIAAVAAPVVIGAVASQPLKAAEAVAKAPSSLANVGANVANLVADPSLKNVKTLITENPVLVGGAAAAGAVAAGAGAAGLVSGYLTRQELEKQTEALERSAAAAEGAILGEGTGQVLEKEKVTATDEGKAITPETTTITTGKKRYRRATIKEKPSVRQNVRVIVANRATSTGLRIRNERYLNQRILA